MCEKLFLKAQKAQTAFYFIFYSYLWAGNKLGLNLVIFFQIELVSFYLFLLQKLLINKVNSKF